VDPNLATACPSPCSPKPSSSIEQIIGETIAMAACAVARGVGDLQDGGLALKTKLVGADLIAQLYALRQECAGAIDFEVVARIYGKQVLRALPRAAASRRAHR